MHLFIIPLLVMIVTQAIKMTVAAYKGKFSWNLIQSYGGMPSSHAALVTSLVISLGYSDGYDTPAFAVAAILFVIVIRDSMKPRYQIGVHGKIINQLIKELPDRKEYQFPVLGEQYGHTPAEVVVGVLVGAVGTAVAMLLYI